MLNRFSKSLLKGVMCVVRVILAPFIWLINLGRVKRIPPITEPLLLLSATKLAEKIRNKEIKAEMLVRAYIERCQEVNPLLNAIVQPRYEAAIEEAKNVDSIVASGKYTTEELKAEYPLLGIPLTVKESIAVAGMSNAAGRITAKPLYAKEDAQCIAQARAAGAIVLLVSNTPELCLCWETFNNITGTTNNPYDTKRTPGGSSGGEAALISSGASVIGVGSDIAGSLRLPAHYTGIYGHKPTPYAVSTVGHMPCSNSDDWNKFFTLGPMARYAEDLPLLLSVLNNSKGLPLQLNQKADITDIKYFYMEGEEIYLAKGINSDVRKALHKLIHYFDETHKITVAKPQMKYIKYAFESSLFTILQLDGVENIYSKPEDPYEWHPIWPEVIKKMFGCSNSTLTSVLYGPLKKLSDKIGEKKIYTKANKINEALKEEFVEILGDNGVLFYPTFHEPAHYHYNYLANLLNYTCLFMFNSLGFPVTNCPLGLTKKGLPVGIQVVASPGCDHLCLAVAQELEKAFGGWVEPC